MHQGSCHLLDDPGVACRHGQEAATVIQPVREVGMRDLAMMCHFQKLPIIAPLHNSTLSKPSINTLAEDFVARLQGTVPSSVSTIIRTAGKLQVTGSLGALKQCVKMMY